MATSKYGASGEIELLTGRRPSAPYDHKKNAQNQEEIIKTANEALKNNLSYGKYTARQYANQVKVVKPKGNYQTYAQRLFQREHCGIDRKV